MLELGGAILMMACSFTVLGVAMSHRNPSGCTFLLHRSLFLAARTSKVSHIFAGVCLEE